MANNINKARYWVGVLYLENMVENWETDIADLIQLPYAYCVHNLDKDSESEHRKDHVHIIIVFPNTTTYNNAMNVFNILSANGKKALNTCQAIVSIRQMYEYLIHNTDGCKKKNKHLYNTIDRITGNNFDIGSYEQVSIAEKNDICKELCDLIIDMQFCNFSDFYLYAMQKYDDTNYFEVLKTYSGLLERLTRGNYLKYKKEIEDSN